MNDAITYFNKIVIPTIRDFENEPASARRAFLASVALFHTVDYLAAQPGLPNKKILRSLLRKENSDFAMIDRIAHAFKHLEAGNERAPDNKPLSVRAIFSRPPSIAGVMEAGVSQVGDTQGGVEISNERGSDLLLSRKEPQSFFAEDYHNPASQTANRYKIKRCPWSGRRPLTF